MIYLKIAKLKPGMTLAEPVHSPQGVLLSKKGAELTEKDIWVLKSWGVTKAWVDGEDIDGKNRDVKRENEARTSIENELKEKFSDVLDDPVMMEIMRVASRELLEKFFDKEDQNETS